MALVLPVLFPLLFGSFELGNYFLDSHIVTKAARDGARYASRSLPLKATCTDTIDTSLASTTTVIANTQNITTYGQLTSGTPRLPGWTPAAVVVSFQCRTAGAPAGLFDGMGDGAPVVTVSIAVNYNSLFGNISRFAGISTNSLTLSSKSEVPVMGL